MDSDTVQRICRLLIAEAPLRIAPVGSPRASVSRFRIETANDAFLLQVGKSSKEAFVLKTLEQFDLAGDLIFHGMWKGRNLLLRRWFSGETLESALTRTDDEEANRLGTLIGRELAKLRAVRLPFAGFLDKDGSIRERLEMDAEWFLQHTGRLARQASLDQSLKQRCLCYIAQNVEVLSLIDDRPHLVHGDFHARNIIVSKSDDRWQLCGFIDWEAAMSWSTLLDIAFLTRREQPNHHSFETGLLSGYGLSICWSEWERVRTLLQLLGWLDALAAFPDDTERVKDANRMIARLTDVQDIAR